MTRPLKIAYLSHDPLPSGDTNTEQIAQTAWALAGLGLAVDLVVPAASPKPAGAAATSPAERTCEIASYYGIDPCATAPGLVELGPRLGGGPLRQALHDARAALWSRGRGHDLLYTRDVAALPLALATGAPVVFETYRYDLSQLARFAPWRALCYQQRGLIGVVTHSRLAAQAFAEAGIEGGRILVAHNGFDPRPMLPARDRAAARDEVGLPADGPLVVYTGHVGPRKGTGTLLDLAASLPAARFALVGGVAGSSELAALERATRERRLTNVHLIPRVPPAGLTPFLQAADVLIIPPTAEPLREHRRTVLPMKTFLYLAAGRPIVAPDLPDLREVLEDGRNALLVPPDSLAQATAAIASVLADEALAARLAAAAEVDARSFTWEARAARIAAFLAARLAATSR